MVKTRPKSPKPTPTEIKMKNKQKKSRKRSIAQSASSHSKIFIEDTPLPQNENDIHHKLVKSNQLPDDIDMYFDSCFNYKIRNKEEILNQEKTLKRQSAMQEQIQQELQKEIKQQSQNQNQIIKKEIQSQQFQPPSQNPFFQIDQPSILEKSHEIIEDESPESPVFGLKIMNNNFKTPPNKQLEQLKVYDQSEQIGSVNIFDQLSQVQKNYPSFTPQKQKRKQILKTEKRISKQKKSVSSSAKRKIKIQQDIQRSNLEFSFKRSNPKDQIKRRTQCLKISTLTQIHSHYDKAEKQLQCLENSIKTLINYYTLKEMNSKILSFRMNVAKLIKQEIQKILQNIKGKREICFEQIYDKIKLRNQKFDYSEERMRYPDLA